MPRDTVGIVLGEGSPSPAQIFRAAGEHKIVFISEIGECAEASTGLAASLAPLIEVSANDMRAAELDRYGLVGITTFSDASLTITAHVATAAGLPYHAAPTTSALTLKSAQRDQLAAAGVDSTRSVVVTDRASLEKQLDGTAMVVKPVTGRGSIDTFLVRDPTDLPDDLNISVGRAFLVEEYLMGRETYPYGDYVSVETITVAGVTHALGVTGKFALLRPFREPGQYFPAHLGDQEQSDVIKLAVRAVSALGVERGLAHTEIKLTPSGPRIIEVNGRLGGQIDELYKRALGLDLLAMEIALAAGRTPALTRTCNPPPESLRVFFQYNNLAPIKGGTFLGVTGQAAVRARPRIAAYRSFFARGAELPHGVTTARLDLLTGSASDHDTMITELDEALAELRFSIAGEDGPYEWQPTRDGLRCTG